VGELEAWLYSHSAAWSRRSFYKRLLPLFAHAVRHRWLAENPMLLLRAPDLPADAKAIYTGEQFNALLVAASASQDKYLLPFIVLTGFCWMRTSELVRLHSGEGVLDAIAERNFGPVAIAYNRSKGVKRPPFCKSHYPNG
jgi:hypothetical protein